ncbi:Myc-type, basic helix-loop-helix (bHLH) domain [Dillenia turbinata]|uniref:Myc-type, basic helix-loop-helix (BHLH) domain n=1 Tax=Dillenia turbinata TaxID=194707 RepID=A0AAN8W5T8_9MAGN
MQSDNSEQYRRLAGTGGSYGLPVGNGFDYEAVQSYCSSSSFYPFELSGITETPEDRALIASRNHKEAEKRRRERINSHLDRLRSLLPCNSKTDKASLLGKVIERVKELKQQTSQITDLDLFPSESDEIAVFTSDFDGQYVLKASLCCQDRSDLIPDLIQTLKSLKLKTLRSEIATLGGRVRNILVVAGDDHVVGDESVVFLREALKSLVQRSSPNMDADRGKRRRIIGIDNTRTT